MKTKMIIVGGPTTEKHEDLNRFFTNSEKKRMSLFFENYVDTIRPDFIIEQENETQKKMYELKEKGFEPKISKEVKYNHSGYAGNMSISITYRITWPCNFWLSENENLAQHYRFSDAFLNDERNFKEINEAEDIQKIISRAVSFVDLGIENCNLKKEVKSLQSELNVIKKKYKKLKN